MRPTLKNGKPFIVPKNVDLNQSGIYKISFDEYFYIGSTSNFKKRIQVFRSLGGKKGSAFNKKMYECAKACSVISFEIIQVIDDVSLLREIETGFIKQFIGNPLLINRAFDANSNKGIQWTEEEKIKISNNTKGKWKIKSPAGIIEKYSIAGDFIASYTSCMMAGKDSGMSHKMVAAILKGEKPNYNGVVFLRIITPIPEKLPPKQRGNKKGYKFSEEAKNSMRQKRINNPPQLPAHSKTVIQYDLSGKMIQKFPSIGAAAKSLGVNPKLFKDHLKVKRHKKGIKGFVFKLEGDNSPVELLVKKEPVVRENAGKVRSRFAIDTETGEQLTVKEVSVKLGLTIDHTYKTLGGYDGFVNKTKYRYGEGYIWKYA